MTTLNGSVKKHIFGYVGVVTCIENGHTIWQIDTGIYRPDEQHASEDADFEVKYLMSLHNDEEKP